MTDQTPQPRHFFTVDLEEYFQVLAFAHVVSPNDWPRYPARAEQCTDRLLELLEESGARATFFTVGWLAERTPGLVRRIVEAGHEIASHSWWHRHLKSLTPKEFREDVRRTRGLLENQAGSPVVGFRAPSFSISPGREWAFDILLEEGYSYDSSVFPIKRPDYGFPGAPRVPYLIERPAGTLLELPLATTRLAGMTIPAAGGGYLRHLPFALVRRAFREHQRAGQPGMFYIHPWEIDPDQPRMRVGWITRRRHYAGLGRTWHLLKRLLSEFRFTSVAHYYGIDRMRDENLPWPPALSA